MKKGRQLYVASFQFKDLSCPNIYLNKKRSSPPKNKRLAIGCITTQRRGELYD